MGLSGGRDAESPYLRVKSKSKGRSEFSDGDVDEYKQQAGPSKKEATPKFK